MSDTKRTGRKGRPSKGKRTSVNVRMPDTLLQELDAFVDKHNASTGLHTDRTSHINKAIREYLSREKKALREQFGGE